MKRPFLTSFLVPPLLLASVATAADVRHEMLTTTDWLADHLDDPGVAVVHVGGREGYDSGHVPGAVLLPWDAIAVDRDGIPNEFPEIPQLVAVFEGLGLDAGDRIVLYDESRGIPAARAFLALDLVGLADKAALLDGQLEKWRQEGRPLSTDRAEPSPSHIRPTPHPALIVGVAEMMELYGGSGGAQPYRKLVDARPAEQYTGEVPGRDVRRAGHIPRAVHVYWQEHLAKTGPPVMRPAEELLELYAAKGLRPDDEVITYCRSGAQSSHTYFTLKYLGFAPRMYDGSYVEWNAEEARPIATGTQSMVE